MKASKKVLRNTGKLPKLRSIRTKAKTTVKRGKAEAKAKRQLNE